MWNPPTCSCKSGKYLANIMDDLVIMCYKIIDAATEAKSGGEAKLKNKETKNILKIKLMKQKVSLFILLTFSLIKIALLAAVSIYCYLIKYKSKQKHLLPFHITK